MGSLKSWSTKKIILSVTLLLAIATVLFFYINQIPVMKINMSGELSEGFQSIEELTNSSEIIAKVNIQNSKSISYEDVVFSLASANVMKVFKGDYPNQTITILETGGIKNNIEYVFEDNKTLKKNEQAILFLRKYNGPITKDAYVILGVFQGKFLLEKDSNHVINGKNKLGELAQVNSIEALNLK